MTAPGTKIACPNLQGSAADFDADTVREQWTAYLAAPQADALGENEDALQTNFAAERFSAVASPATHAEPPHTRACGYRS